MGKREGEQEDLFVTHQQLRSQSHPFYRAVNRVLADQGFDRHVEGLCAKFYAKKMGRPRGLLNDRVQPTKTRKKDCRVSDLTE